IASKRGNLIKLPTPLLRQSPQRFLCRLLLRRGAECQHPFIGRLAAKDCAAGSHDVAIRGVADIRVEEVLEAYTTASVSASPLVDILFHHLIGFREAHTL